MRGEGTDGLVVARKPSNAGRAFPRLGASICESGSRRSSGDPRWEHRCPIA
jgi:hypothetical protein